MSSRRSRRGRTARFLGLSLVTHALLVLLLFGTELGRACDPQRAEFPATAGSGLAIDVTMLEAAPLNPFAPAAAPDQEREQERALEEKRQEVKKQEEDPHEAG